MSDAPTSDVARELSVEIATRARVEPSAVGMDAHLMAELGLSSMDLLSVLAYAEKRYGMIFPDDELLNLSTLRKIEEAVAAHRATGAPKGSTK